MAVAAILRVSFQMMLMFFRTSDIIRQRQYFYYNLIPVFPMIDKGFCLFKMLLGSTVNTGSMLLLPFRFSKSNTYS